MNRAATIALTVGGGVLLYNLLTKAQALQTLNFYPASLKNISFDGVTPIATFGLAVQNTSGQAMTIRSFAGNLYANGNLIGNISSYLLTTIKANSETVLFINARLSILGVVNDIIQAFQGNGFKQIIELDAWANVNNYQVPIKIKYSVGA